MVEKRNKAIGPTKGGLNTKIHAIVYRKRWYLANVKLDMFISILYVNIANLKSVPIEIFAEILNVFMIVRNIRQNSDVFYIDGLGNPVAFLLSPGNDEDSTHAIELMNMTDITGSNSLADKASGTKEILAYIIEHEATVVIPLKSNAKETWSVDYWIYKERHLVE